MAPYVPKLSKASALREVAQRYARKARRGAGHKPRTQAAIRCAELTRLFDDKFGPMVLPDNDDGYQAARVMVHHIGRLRHGDRRMASWLNACAGFLSMADRERLISEVEECPLKWTADKLAWKFKVTAEQRARLKLTTIGAIDLPKAERIKRRTAIKNARRQAQRHEQGAMSRAEYRQTVQSAKPWTEQGVSRATWYRNRPIET